MKTFSYSLILATSIPKGVKTQKFPVANVFPLLGIGLTLCYGKI